MLRPGVGTSKASQPSAVGRPAPVEHRSLADRLDWITAGERARESGEVAARRSRLTILDRYLLKEMAAPFGFAAAAFTLFLLVNAFFLAADYIINKGVPFGLTFRYIILQLPGFMYLILPFAALFGILLGVGRLVGDNELTAMRTHGVSLHRIALPCYVGGAVLAVVAFGINEGIAPRAFHKSQMIFNQIAYHASQPIVQPDQFIRTEDGQHVIFIGSVDSGTGVMHGVRIDTLGRGGFYSDTLTAVTGRQLNGKIVLSDGVLTQFGPDGLVTKQQRFKTLDFPLGDTNLLFAQSQSPFEMNSRDLTKKIQAEKGAGFDIRRDEMTLHQKYAMPLACLVGVLIALPLSIRFGKRGRGVAAMLAVVLVFVYYLIMAATDALGKNGALPPPLAAWISNFVIGSVGLALLLREER